MRTSPDGSFEMAVIEAINSLGPGEVASYGEIAQEAGWPGAARAVGNILKTSEGLPWWRVIRSDGSLAATNRTEQARRLRAEGVKVWKGKVRVR